MTTKYNLESTKAIIYLIAKGMKDPSMEKTIMNVGKSLTAEDLKDDFDFNKAVIIAKNAPSEYKDTEKETNVEPDPDDDQVNNPSHYQSKVPDLNIDAISCMRAAFGNEEAASFCICNALKYIFRHQFKNGKTDVLKAVWYLNKYLELNE